MVERLKAECVEYHQRYEAKLREFADISAVLPPRETDKTDELLGKHQKAGAVKDRID